MGKKLTKVKETIKKDMPKTRKGKIFGIIFGVLTPISLGIVGGVVYSKFFMSKSVDYTNINADDLVVDTTGIMDKYASYKDKDVNYNEVFKPYEMVNIAYTLYEQEEHSRSYTIGTATASIVNQSIRGCSIRDGNNYFEESLSKSDMVGVAARAYLKEDNTIDFYRGNVLTATTASWGDIHIPYTSESYTSDFGKTPATSLIYIINKKTVLANTSTVERNGDNYVINMSLHPTKAVINYVKQMKSISDLYEYPAFSKVDISFTLEKDLMIKEMHVNEIYYARKTSVVGADTEGDVTVYYEVGGEYTIPTLSEQVSYPEK